jgi:glutaredoxin
MLITVYTKPGCSGCEAVKNRFRNASIDFAESDAGAPELLAELRCAGKAFAISDIVAPIIKIESALGDRYYLYDQVERLCEMLGA